jgi:flagellin-specific chaperone FliS|tara:strand:- start:639 stop:818 length:180 start_codon:yes stop_codon:yes gene_type:complete
MKINPKDLTWIRKGLSSEVVKSKAENDKEAVQEVQQLLDRLDTMEKEFYKNNAPQQTNN